MAADVGFLSQSYVYERADPCGNGTTQGTTYTHVYALLVGFVEGREFVFRSLAFNLQCQESGFFP